MSKVLIVDDEPHILILMEQVLESLAEDYEVVLLRANNGAAALDLVYAEHPQLLFLDVMMPKLSGLEVCQRLKADPNLQDLYVVMLTAKGQESDLKMGMAMGADLYITKPFRPKEILQLSKKVLGLD